MDGRPIANKYREGKMKRTLKRELKVLEIVEGEGIGSRRCARADVGILVGYWCRVPVSIDCAGREKSRICLRPMPSGRSRNHQGAL